MKYILTILFVLATLTNLSAHDSNQSENFITKSEANQLINNEILDTIEGINSAISNNLTALAIFLTIMGICVVLLGLMNFHQKRQLMIRINEEIEQHVDKRFYAKSKEIEQDISQKLTSFVRSSIINLKKEYQKEEFLRNLIFWDLSNMLSSELNDSDNIAEVFSTYSGRYYLIAQLTGDTDKGRAKALKKLATEPHDNLRKLQSFKDYIAFIDSSDTNFDVSNQIQQLDLA